MILSHSNIADSDTHAQDLLQLELDGGLDLVDLGAQILVVRDWGREFTSCRTMLACAQIANEGGEHTLGETGTQETGNLLDECIGSNESIVLASKLLDELLVLVKLLQVIRGHGIDTTMLRTINIVLVTENAVPSSAHTPCIPLCV